MLVLALDSSTRTGSVALARDGVLLEARVGDAARRHAVRLPSDLLLLLEAHGARLADVDLLAVATGPGGFTGLRVGLATIQGLALGLERPIVPACTLELLALAAGDVAPDASVVGAWMHGMRGDVFAALYRLQRDNPDHPMILSAPAVGTPADAAETWRPLVGVSPLTVVGDGWPDLAGPLQAAFDDRVRAVDGPLLAGVLARYATRQASHAVGPAALRPTYVRRPDAVLAREQAGDTGTAS